MDDILREVQEDLQHERLMKLWKHYGNYFLGALIAIVLATASFVFWNHYKDSKNAEESIEFAKAMSLGAKGKEAEAHEILVSLSEKGGAFAGIASLRRAAALVKSEETKEKGIALYHKMSKDSGLSAAVRQVSGYFYVLHSLETADPDKLSVELSKYLVGGNPWSFMVKELKAVLSLKMSKPDQALQIYKELLNNPQSPSGVRMRAQAMISQLSSE